MHWLAQSVESHHIGSNLVFPGPAPGPGWLRSLWTSSPAQTLTWPSSPRLWGRPPGEDGSQDSFSKLRTLQQIGGVHYRVVLRWSPRWINLIIYRVSIFKIPPPLPQPSGCRADTQIACPGSDHRICNVQRCDGEEDCPRLPGQEISWDESEGCVTTTTPSSILSTTTSIVTTTTGAVQKWVILEIWLTASFFSEIHETLNKIWWYRNHQIWTVRGFCPYMVINRELFTIHCQYLSSSNLPISSSKSLTVSNSLSSV